MCRFVAFRFASTFHLLPGWILAAVDDDADVIQG